MSMKTKKSFFILLSILVFGGALRLLWLGSVPSGFFRDEAALGYNAYSIWETGKDEFGVILPLVFRSFEVFFLPLYVYLSAPIVGVLGLSETTTRLLSSVSGILALVIIYLIGKKMGGEKIGLFSAFVLAVSPWHIFYSRGAYEGNLALTLFAFGFLFWIVFLRSRRRLHLFISTFFFALSMYSYQSERIVVPLFALCAAFLSFNKLWKLKVKLVLPLFFISIVLIPIISLSFSPGGYHRAFGVSVFAKDENPPGWIEGEKEGILLNNGVLLRMKQIGALYLSYFSPRNLFVEGDYNRQRSTENFSVFYSLFLPFMVVGFWIIFKRRLLEDKLLLSWILLAPIPAALTADPFHTYRSLMLYLPLTLLVGIGASYFWEKIKFKYVFWGVFTLISSISLVLFLFNYSIINNASRGRDWDFGYKELVGFLNTLPKGKRVVIDDPGTEAYIHLLFFGKVDPNIYHKEVLTLGDPGIYYYNDPSEIRPDGFDRYEFRNVNWAEVRGDKDSIFVFTLRELPDSEFKSDPKIKLLRDIKYPDGEIAYRVVEVY